MLREHTTVLGPSSILSGTTRVSRHQKGKTNLDLLKQDIVNGSGISCAICKSAPWPRHILTPASHHSVFYMPDALPATQPTASKNWRHSSENLSSWNWKHSRWLTAKNDHLNLSMYSSYILRLRLTKCNLQMWSFLQILRTKYYWNLFIFDWVF